MRGDEARTVRLRSRLAAALAAAIAIAFVVTVAAVAASPPAGPDRTVTAPPTTGPSDPTSTPAPTAPERAPADGREPPRDDEAPDDGPPGDEVAPTEAGPTAPAPAPPTRTAAPEPPARSDQPPADVGDEPDPAPPDHGAKLWGRWFRAEHLRQGDETVVVAGDRPLHVGFLRQERGDGLVWTTSCNTFGGDLEVGPERLAVRDIGGTSAECDEVQHDQEAWLEAFLAAGPHWRGLGERLRLWTPDGRRIDLVEDTEGPGPPWS